MMMGVEVARERGRVKNRSERGRRRVVGKPRKSAKARGRKAKTKKKEGRAKRKR